MPAATTVTPEQIERIVELRAMRKLNGKHLHTFKAIGGELGLTKSQVEYIYYREQGVPRKVKPVVAEIKVFPATMIGGGEVRAQPVQPPLGRYGKNHCRQSSCDFCPLREECDEAVAGWCNNFIGCERAIEREMVE